MFRFLRFGILILLISVEGFSQQIENLKPRVVNNNIEVTFDLIDDADGKTYDLQLFSSFDNYTNALSMVRGDIGNEVVPGRGKKVMWEAKREIGDFKGDIYLEIRASPTPPFVKLTNPSDGKMLRRGKTAILQWSARAGSPDVKLELLRGKSVVSILSPSSIGSYTWLIPSSFQKGKDYSIRITDTSNPNRIVTSNYFTIGNKIPTIIKAVPIALLVGVAVIVLQGGGNGNGTPPINGNGGDERIPDPALPN